MDISTKLDDTKATLVVAGKMTVQTSPDLEAAVGKLDLSTHDVDIDLAQVSYISSAGLRVLVATQKLVVRNGKQMRLLHACDEVMEVFEMTGLSEVFVIEQ